MVSGASNSTINFRLLDSEVNKKEQSDEPVFEKLPSQQEISSDLSAGGVPVMIYLPGSIRIEIGAGCPVGLMASLIHTLSAYA